MEPGRILEEILDIGYGKAEKQRMNIEEGKLLQHTKGEIYKVP